MEQNPLRVPVAELVEGETLLDPAASRYVSRVHRLRPGQAILLFDPSRAVEAAAVLVSTSRDGVRCRVSAPRPAPRSVPCSVTLLQAIGKSDKPERVVRDATVLGVRSVVFVETSRSVARLGDRAAKRAVRWRAVALDAARQSGRGDLPDVVGPLAVEDAFARLEPESLRVILDVSAEVSLAAVLGGSPAASAVALLVGPEGGFSLQERAAARGAGFVAARLGRLVLRTETATTAALGAVVSRW